MKWIGQHIYDFVSRFRNTAIFGADSSKTTTISSSDITLTNDGSSFDPSITLINTNSGNDSAYIFFKKEGDNGADNDRIAEYRYSTLDDTGSSVNVGTEQWKLADASNGAIKGKYTASMTAHTSNLTFFEAEAVAASTINVDIARGSSSTTTIKGDLTVSGGDISLSGTGRIQGIDTVTDATDAASKAYVDAAINSDIDLTSEVSGVLPIANGGTNSSSTTYCSLTANVSGTLPVANGGTGATSLTDNKLLTGTGTSAITAEANATYDGTDFTLLSASQYKPILKLHNQNNSAESPELLFLNQRTSDASGVSANGDEAGKITFQSINNRGSGSGGPEDITYAQVKGSIFDNTDGGEDGRLALQVTEGGSLTTAFDAYGTGLGTINTFGNGGIFSYSNFDSTLTFFTSSVSTAPNVSISNYADDATGPTLTLGNLRGGISGGKTDGSDNDSCGTINFNAYDDGTPTATTFAKIEGIAKDVSDGAEEGKLTLSVASHDAEIQPGLTIESGDAEDEVDVTIGNGSASVVTVPGFISIGGHTINDIDVAGEFVDSDEHLMTAAAINDRIAAAGGSVSVSDSTANTDFPVVFHDESNNLHDDTGAFTYNPSTGNAVIPKIQTAGNIELGHASDTTIARSGAGRVTIEGNTIITAGDEVVSAGNHILKQTKVTIDTSGFNGLNSTPVDLVAAQGANTMIVPTEVVVFADRAATNTNSTDLIVAYNGGTSFATAVKYIRRFMQNVTTDRITIMGPYVGTASNDLTTPINSKLTIALGAAPTTNCMTSLTVYTSYYVIDIS